MKSFDELLSMPDTDKLAYLREESQKLIDNAAPHNQLKMQALQAKCDNIRRTHKAPYLACLMMVELMLDSAQRMAR